MALMSASDRARAARILTVEIYVRPNSIAIMNYDALLAAIGAIDDAMEGTPASMPNQGQSVALNLNAMLSEPFKSTASPAQKSTALGIWAQVKYGLM